MKSAANEDFAAKDVAKRAAVNAGDILKKFYRKRLNVKADLEHDIKLEVDHLCEEKIIKTIRKEFPGHRIISEESGEISGDGQYVWIIDPLDGTVNYFRGLPFFCTSIGVFRLAGNEPLTGSILDRCEPVAGVIYAPVLEELFCTGYDEIARLNGRELSIGPGKSLEDSVISISIGSSEKTVNEISSIIPGLAQRVKKIRSFGSTALDLAYISAGFLDGMLHRNIKIWDIAAGSMILEKSGGVVSFGQTAPGTYDILASSRAVYEGLMSITGNAVLT